MLVQGKRPRQLHWYHAGPMLFGDWGTSRLYVLGLCFFYTRHASLWFMLAMSGLLVAVGWAYSIICRLYPDGGGVYSSARARSQTLAVIGALLLCADYVVTAALSALDAFHYAGLHEPQLWAAGSIAAIGVLNYFGPTKAGTLALIVAILTVIFTFFVGVAAVPALPQAHLEPPHGHPGQWWTQFTAIILAISGVEAVANMTGIMVEPVEKTARRAIWPVLIEIVILNLVLTLAMLALPMDILGDGDPSKAFSAHRDDMLKLLAAHYIGPTFATIASLVFALLLLSAVNTAVTDLVSIQFMMSRDNELPRLFGGLNRYGMPVLPLFFSTLIPLATVLAVPDVGHLADLYAIGVVGAVAVNLGTCSTTRSLPLGRWERSGMFMLAFLMVAMWFTIAWEKPWALVFALGIMGAGLTARWGTHNRELIRQWFLAPVAHPWQVEPVAEAAGLVLLAPSREPPPPAHPPVEPAYVVKQRVMVSTRGNPRLVKFALEQAVSRQAELLVLYVRHVAVPLMGDANRADVNDDPEAKALFAEIQQQAEALGVPLRFHYVVASDIAEAILEIAATHAVDVLVLGATKRGVLWQTMKGDVIQQVAQYLPETTTLLIQA